MEKQISSFSFLGLVAVVAVPRGLWPALLAALVSVACLDFFLYAPMFARPTAVQDVLNLVVFVATACLVGGLTPRRRGALLKSEALAKQLGEINAELLNARAELIASCARVVATSDETRRRIERDLHHGSGSRWSH